MQLRRNGHGVYAEGGVVRDGRVEVLDAGLLYVAGGIADLHLSSVECYNPDTDTWSPVASMNQARYYPGLVSHDGALYAIGGYEADTIEVYNTDTNTWTVMDSRLEAKVEFHGACLGVRCCLHRDFIKIVMD